MRGLVGAVAGLALGVAIAACSVRGSATGPNAQTQRGHISNLDVQIRGWRLEAGLDVDPPPQLVPFLRDKSVRQAAAVCPDSHVPPRECNDICDLADAICENAEEICIIADDVGDAWSKGKCNEAKVSCKQAKERCCACDNNKRAAVYETAEEMP